MATVAESPRRLFCLIVLAVFFPYASMAIEFGRSRELAITLVAGLLVPSILMSTERLPCVIIGHISAFSSFLYTIYMLCSRRYTPVSQDEESTVTGTPQVGEATSAKTEVADPSIAKV